MASLDSILKYSPDVLEKMDDEELKALLGPFILASRHVPSEGKKKPIGETTLTLPSDRGITSPPKEKKKKESSSLLLASLLEEMKKEKG